MITRSTSLWNRFWILRVHIRLLHFFPQFFWFPLPTTKEVCNRVLLQTSSFPPHIMSAPSTPINCWPLFGGPYPTPYVMKKYSFLQFKDDSDYLAFKETTWSYRSTFLCKPVSSRSQPIQICCTTITNMQTELWYVHLYQKISKIAQKYMVQCDFIKALAHCALSVTFICYQ